jgi:hypothetical protein
MQQRNLLTFIFVVLLVIQIQPVMAASSQTIEHIVIIWLQEPGNTRAQDRIIKASQSLKTIPGVISLRSGKAVPSQRKIVDSSFDVALIISFINKAALDAYLVHPAHLKLLEETMKPLVDRIRVYDLR